MSEKPVWGEDGNFAVPLAQSRAGVLCDAHFKQEDYRAVIDVCIIYSLLLLLLLQYVSLHTSSVKTVAAPAADMEEFDGVWELPAALNLWQLESVL